jgi:hypothetical protein
MVRHRFPVPLFEVALLVAVSMTPRSEGRAGERQRYYSDQTSVGRFDRQR